MAAAAAIESNPSKWSINDAIEQVHRAAKK